MASRRRQQKRISEAFPDSDQFNPEHVEVGGRVSLLNVWLLRSRLPAA